MSVFRSKYKSFRVKTVRVDLKKKLYLNNETLKPE